MLEQAGVPDHIGLDLTMPDLEWQQLEVDVEECPEGVMLLFAGLRLSNDMQSHFKHALLSSFESLGVSKGALARFRILFCGDGCIIADVRGPVWGIAELVERPLEQTLVWNIPAQVLRVPQQAALRAQGGHCAGTAPHVTPTFADVCSQLPKFAGEPECPRKWLGQHDEPSGLARQAMPTCDLRSQLPEFLEEPECPQERIGQHGVFSGLEHHATPIFANVCSQLPEFTPTFANVCLQLPEFKEEPEGPRTWLGQHDVPSGPAPLACDLRPQLLEFMEEPEGPQKRVGQREEVTGLEHHANPTFADVYAQLPTFMEEPERPREWSGHPEEVSDLERHATPICDVHAQLPEFTEELERLGRCDGHHEAALDKARILEAVASAAAAAAAARASLREVAACRERVASLSDACTG